MRSSQVRSIATGELADTRLSRNERSTHLPSFLTLPNGEVQLKECEDISNAPEKEGSFRSRKTTWIEQCSEIRSSYLYRLPGIQDKPEWLPNSYYHVAVQGKRAGFSKGKSHPPTGKSTRFDKISNYHLLTNPEIARQIASRKFSRMKEKAAGGGIPVVV
jgi:hypothetical protein